MQEQDTITLNYEEYCSLCNIVDYLHDNELKHYEESIEEDGSYNKHHIWHSVNTLSLTLKKIQQEK